jgi:hypothetical protein
MEPQERIKETVWAAALATKLHTELSGYDQNDLKISVKPGEHLPYAYEIHAYGTEPESDMTNQYETDLLVSDRLSENLWIPRVIIECKLMNINTHDPLAYSAKAATHKHVHPYLRYGILVGHQKTLPPRLVRHGSNFDFMVTWKAFDASPTEWKRFCELLRHEVHVSRKLQDLLRNVKQGEPYQSLHRRLVLE